jgi:hypothetical protein
MHEYTIVDERHVLIGATVVMYLSSPIALASSMKTMRGSGIDLQGGCLTAGRDRPHRERAVTGHNCSVIPSDP